MANYCFFKMSNEYMDRGLSDMEIAHLNNISVETVKEVEKEALEKMRNHKEIKKMKELHKGEPIVADSSKNDPFGIY